MKCDEVLALIEDYHYGELAPARATRVAAHLRDCHECALALAELETENRLYQAYAEMVERQFEVTPVLWEGVRERIAGLTPDGVAPLSWGDRLKRLLGALVATLVPASPVLRQTAFAVVLVAVSVTGTLIAVNFFQSEPPQIAGHATPKPAEPVAPPSVPQPAHDAATKDAATPDVATPDKSGEATRIEPRPERPERAPRQREVKPRQTLPPSDLARQDAPLALARQKIQRAQSEYLAAIRILSAEVNKRKATFDPKLAAEFERNLKIIDENIAATRRAYQANPQNIEVAQYMLTAYAKKVELLQDMVY